MNFVGTGKRLTQGDIGDAARAVGVGTAVILSILEVEAAGQGFDAARRPKILPERHKFYAFLGNTAARARAVAAGLAYPIWGTKPYPRSSDDRYDLLGRMITIAETHALRATSWGLPQILGDNHRDAGFTSPQAMVAAMMQGEREQLLALVALLKAWGLIGKLKGRDLTRPASWKAFARRYNGPAYAKHNYHGRMAAAYEKHAKRKGEYAAPAQDPLMLLPGMKGEAVRNLQADLQAIGYVFELGVDGRYGPETARHVRDFQQRHGLKVDGKAGPETLGKLDEIAAPEKGREVVEKAPPGLNRPGLGALIAAILAAVARIFTNRKE